MPGVADEFLTGETQRAVCRWLLRDMKRMLFGPNSTWKHPLASSESTVADLCPGTCALLGVGSCRARRELQMAPAEPPSEPPGLPPGASCGGLPRPTTYVLSILQRMSESADDASAPPSPPPAPPPPAVGRRLEGVVDVKQNDADAAFFECINDSIACKACAAYLPCLFGTTSADSSDISNVDCSRVPAACNECIPFMMKCSDLKRQDQSIREFRADAPAATERSASTLTRCGLLQCSRAVRCRHHWPSWQHQRLRVLRTDGVRVL